MYEWTKCFQNGIVKVPGCNTISEDGVFAGIGIHLQFLPLYDPEVTDACNYTSNGVNISLSLSSYGLVIFTGVRCTYR